MSRRRDQNCQLLISSVPPNRRLRGLQYQVGKAVFSPPSFLSSSHPCCSTGLPSPPACYPAFYHTPRCLGTAYFRGWVSVLINDLHAQHTAEKWWSWAGIQEVRAFCIALFSPCLAHSTRSANSSSFPSCRSQCPSHWRVRSLQPEATLAPPFPLEVALVPGQISAFSGGVGVRGFSWVHSLG